jgi:ABC-type phosphate transport system substrate-binding protein
MPRRAVLAGIAAAAVGLAGIAGIGAQDAHAAFTIPECQGASSVKGQGASFQKDLHIFFKTEFEGQGYGCGGNPTAPSFNANGSGDGIASAGGGGGDSVLECIAARACPTVGGKLVAGTRDLTVSFQASDDPPTTRQVSDAELGDPNNAADDAILHVIPAATGSAALLVRVPTGCNINTVNSAYLTNARDGSLNGADTGDSIANRTARLRFPNRVVDAIFAGDDSADTWGDIAPGISGDPTSAQYAGAYRNDCGSIPIRRIVRFDNSGTTYGWKAYLNLANPGRGWTNPQYTTNPNTTWPDPSGDRKPVAIDSSTAVCPINGVNLCSAAANGGGALADAVNAVDGSIGYADLSTARVKGFDFTGREDHTFWAPLEVDPERGSTGIYAEPTAVPTAHTPGATKGASCGNATVRNLPAQSTWRNSDPTLGDWSAAFAAGGAGVYPACILTYELAWDDSAVVYGASDTEQAKARTVKDYLTRLVSPQGQSAIKAADYSSLPNTASQPLATWAQAGVASIDWNKKANVVTPPPVVVPPVVVPPVVNPPVSPAKPSNAFSVPSSKATSSLMTFTLQLPGKGALKVAATTKVGKRTVRVASASASPKGAGKVTLRLKLSSAAKSALARAKSKKITVAVKFTFTPAGGDAKTITKNVTVRAAKKPVKRAARRHSKKSAKR